MRKGPKVFWKHDEKEQLGVAMDQLINVVKGYTPMSALAAAQNQLLAKDRHRDIKFWATVRDQLQPHITRAREQRETRASVAAPAAATPLPETILPPATPLTELLLQALAPLVAQLLTDPRVASALRAALLPPCQGMQGAYSPAESYVLAAAARAPKPVPLTRRKVLIAGLLPAQAEELKRDFAQHLDLRFWSSDESKDQLRNMAKSLETAIGVTSFMSHPADAILKDLVPNYLRHRGGIKTLKTTLQSLANAPGERAVGQ